MGKTATKPVTPRMKFFITVVFPGIFVAVGVLLLVTGYRDIDEARASADWPNVQGTIVSSAVDSRRSSTSQGRPKTTFHAAVRYEYVVDGANLVGERVAIGDDSARSSSGAREVVDLYPAGSNVAVSYDPANPARSVLEPGVHGRAIKKPIIGVIFLLAGGAMAVYLRRWIAPAGSVEG